VPWKGKRVLLHIMYFYERVVGGMVVRVISTLR